MKELFLQDKNNYSIKNLSFFSIFNAFVLALVISVFLFIAIKTDSFLIIIPIIFIIFFFINRNYKYGEYYFLSSIISNDNIVIKYNLNKKTNEIYIPFNKIKSIKLIFFTKDSNIYKSQITIESFDSENIIHVENYDVKYDKYFSPFANKSFSNPEDEKYLPADYISPGLCFLINLYDMRNEIPNTEFVFNNDNTVYSCNNIIPSDKFEIANNYISQLKARRVTRKKQEKGYFYLSLTILISAVILGVLYLFRDYLFY